MSLTVNEIYVRALLEGYTELSEKRYQGRWHLSDVLSDLDKAIESAGLTSKQREALELVYFEHKEHEEAAVVMGTARVTVTYHIHFAIKKIANIYESWEALI